MKYVILATLMRLLLTVRSQSSREASLINRLNEIFCFDHNIFLVDGSVQDRSRYIPINTKADNEYITPRIVYIFDYKNKLNATQLKLQKTLADTGSNTFLIVVAAELCFNFTNNGTYATNILDEVISIQRGKNRLKIGIFFEKNISSMEAVLQLFQWSWSKKIVKIFCAFLLNAKDDAASSMLNMIRFDPFEAKFLINLTGSDSLEDYFFSGDKIPNYHRHPFRVFKFNDMELSYFHVNFWRTVFHILNASMSIINMTEETYAAGYFEKINEDAGVFRVSVKSIENLVLYPDSFTKLQMLVPHSQPYISIAAYLQNTTWSVLVGYIFVVIATSALLLIVSGYQHTNKRNSFVQCVVDVVNLLMNDNFAIKYGQLHRADIFIVVPLTFTGLVMVNGILSVFKSYLTVPIYQRQIKTIDDLYKSQIPILAKDLLWMNDTIEGMGKINGQRWNEKVHQSNRVQFAMEMGQLNNSVAYATTIAASTPPLKLQKRLNLKAFYLITDPTLADYYATFPINPDFPYVEPLSVIHQRLICNGILWKLLADSTEKEVSKLTKKKRASLRATSNRSDNNGFGGMFTIIWCGWIAGGIVFTCELVWNKIPPQINKWKPTY